MTDQIGSLSLNELKSTHELHKYNLKQHYSSAEFLLNRHTPIKGPWANWKQNRLSTIYEKL